MQIATKQIDEGVRAGIKAAEAGADWLDLNVSCCCCSCCCCPMALLSASYGWGSASLPAEHAGPGRGAQAAVEGGCGLV